MKFTPIDGQGLRDRSDDPGRQFGGIPEYKIPKSRWRYIHLSCGHFTTPEQAELTRLWRPKRGKYWCDSCAKWLKAKPPFKINKVPDEPLF